VETILYPGDNKSHLDYFTDFLTLQDTRFEITTSALGYKLIIKNDIAHKLASHICSFIVDFYIKEAVLSKIYDEYPDFNTNDAGKLLLDLSHRISSSPIKDDILEILTEKKCINPESYAIFNIKQIMRCAYALTDEIASEMIYIYQKEHLVNMMRMFSKINFNNCNSCDVEFSSDNECTVSLDSGKSVTMPLENVIAYLVQASPGNVNIINSSYSPELSSVICEIFNKEQN